MSDQSVPSDELPDPLVGTVIADRYLVEKRLGEGGMGAVYLARHVVLEKQVALKILHGEFSNRKDLVERFLQEAKAATRIRHEHVIDISDFGQTSTGNPFFAMELLSGEDLAHDLRRTGPPTWPRIKSIMLQALSALQAAHDKGIVHRDLKPENMFLIERLGHPDFVKVLDFGIAKTTELEDSGRKLTKTGMVFGTPEYMSPEQARGDKTDHRVDVYAMGCILYQLVCGEVPFRAETFMGVLTRHLFEEVPPLSTRTERTDLPPGFEAVVMKALEKDRDKRFHSMHEMALAIDALDIIPGVAYYAPGSSRPTTATGAQAALLTPVPRTPAGGVAPPVSTAPISNADAMTRMGPQGSGPPMPLGQGTPAPAVNMAASAATVTPAPMAGGAGQSMAELMGGTQRGSAGAAAAGGKKNTGLFIVIGLVVVGGGVGAALALGGGKSKSGEQPVAVAADAGAPALKETVPDAGALVAAEGPVDAGAAVVADKNDKDKRHHRGDKTTPPDAGTGQQSTGHTTVEKPDAGKKEIKDPFNMGGGGAAPP